MENDKIIAELSTILMLEKENTDTDTAITFDSLSSLMLVEFLDSNFKIKISREQIKSFEKISDVIAFINERKN